MNKKVLFTLLVLLISTGAFADEPQRKNLTNAEIVKTPEGIINSLPVATGWEDNQNIILKKASKDYLYNINKKVMTPFTPSEKKIKVEQVKIENAKNPTLSPDGSRVAFTRDNDLYVKDVASGKETRLTFDGSELILNGWASWVYYEEILGRSSKYKAFWWSADSKKLAFYRFDNSNVPMFPIYDAAGQNGTLSETRYPKAGQDNPTVKVGMIDIASETSDRTIVWADFNDQDDQYFGIPYWSGNSELFIVPWMPRDQDEMIVYKVDYMNGEKTSIYEEEQPTWIDWVSVASFTDKGMYMVRDFELWEQIYYLSNDGSKYEKLTNGKNWNIDILKVDEKAGLIFFTAQRDSRVRNDIYKLSLKTKKTERVSFGDFWFSSVKISPDNKSYVATYSNATTPTKLAAVIMGRRLEVEVIADSKGEKFDDYKLALPKLISIQTKDGFTLPASVTYPVDMDSTKRYPVIFSIYGGPNASQTRDNWKGISMRNQLWANQGVIQVTMDCRTAGHSGKAGMNYAYRRLGIIELEDYVLWAEYFKSLPYVDGSKIGITGFSYGGTMTALALLDASEHFKYGIAGAGVYDWALYDTHYGERYMDTPKDNPEGYESTRVANKAKGYIGDKTSMLRLTHGMADDNVHFQNTIQLVDALQKEGKVFELMIYPGAFHGYGGYRGVHSRMSDYIFWYKYLLNSVPPVEFLK